MTLAKFYICKFHFRMVKVGMGSLKMCAMQEILSGVKNKKKLFRVVPLRRNYGLTFW